MSEAGTGSLVSICWLHALVEVDIRRCTARDGIMSTLKLATRMGGAEPLLAMVLRTAVKTAA